ncbi:hypothetical protein M408DRAFT_332296 [Serendipita vermifera MAFF 305830]|uniref:Major facilitator superfamily (MFS) profile domain-containing protein n=1 Tax=Serendipita vermifera MAFF 305830 TaxID=933852 RepID=A0A0C3AWE8_SERVB|nr:hypothetical protein M408DRAFT_332296 [Serendipita vermifera MAFF 305830]
MGSLCATTCSSMVASTYTQVEEEFGISAEVAILGLSLFVGGLGIGPLFLGPLSEFFGRAPIYRYSYLLFVIFNIPVAVGQNAATWLVGRFLSGVSGAAFLSVAGGSVSDLFEGEALSLPMAVYSASPFMGPVLGPIFAGFINQNTSWRWTWYVQIIWATVELALLVFAVPETYSPVLLKRKAHHLRQQTGNKQLRAPLELDNRSIGKTVLMSCTVPFKLVASEPMALALNTWTSILLGILYMFFSAFPIVFTAHGFNLQEKGLTFIGIGVGILAATLCDPLFQRRHSRITERLGKKPPPEEHLVKGLYGAVICPIALFWFAFTTYPSVHWIVPIIASVPFGFGMVLAYSSTFTFLVDAYRPYAASAMASNSFMRSALAAGFPLFTTQMYASLGTVWASAICAFLLLGLAPFPFLFYKYGHRLRKGSKYCHDE